MKKFIFIFPVALMIVQKTAAQTFPTYKPFKVDVGLGIIPKSADPNGLIMFVEPSFTVADHYKAGILLEQAAILGMKNIGAMILAFDYYIPVKGIVRPFVGSGYGYFSTTSYGGCDPGPGTVRTVTQTAKTGPMIRAGVEIRHFRLGIEYNFVPSTRVSAVTATDEVTGTRVYPNRFLSVKGSVSIGGGPKKIGQRPSIL